MKRPLAVTGLFILVASAFLLIADLTYCTYIFCAGALLCVAAVILKKEKASKILFLALTAFVCAALLLTFEQKCVLEPAKLLQGRQVQITGTADEFFNYQNSSSNGLRLKNVSVNGRKLKADIIVYSDDLSCEYGAKIDTVAYVFTSSKAKLGDFYSKISFNAKINKINSVSSPVHKFPVYYAKLLRLKTANLIDANMSQTASSIAKALLIGDKSNFSDDFTKAVQINGLSHLFAVSGMHLSLWTSLIFIILRKRSKTKLYANIGAMLFVLFYIVFTGFSPSVIRAGVMLITVFAGFCFKRRSDGINSLGLSATVLLLIEPLNAVNVSFLMSFNSTAAILMVYPFLEIRMPYAKRRKKLSPTKRAVKILNTVLLSLSVMFFTVPLCGEYFGTVSLLAPLSTLLCSFPAEAIIVLSALACLSFKLKAVSGILFALCEFFANEINATVSFLSKYTFAVCEIDMSTVLFWYLLTFATAYAVYVKSHKNFTKVITSLLICTSLLIPFCIVQNGIDAKRIFLTVSPDGNNGTVLVYTDLGATAVLICGSDDISALQSTGDIISRHNIDDIDLLIVPATNGNASKTAEAVKSLAGVKKVCTVTSQSLSDSRYPDNVCGISNGLTYENYAFYGAGILRCGNIKIVYCSHSGQDFSDAPKELLSADILICRSQIPKTLEFQNYKNIITVSQKTAQNLFLPQNAVSTADSGTLMLTIIPEENRYEFNR